MEVAKSTRREKRKIKKKAFCLFKMIGIDFYESKTKVFRLTQNLLINLSVKRKQRQFLSLVPRDSLLQILLITLFD